jgi:hypothetical protein
MRLYLPPQQLVGDAIRKTTSWRIRLTRQRRIRLELLRSTLLKFRTELPMVFHEDCFSSMANSLAQSSKRTKETV